MKYLLIFILCFGAGMAERRLWKSMYPIEVAQCTSFMMVPVPMPPPPVPGKEL